jgi:hypothetical protein
LELELPLENAGTGGGGLGLWNVAGGLQGDGERGVGQGVGRRERNEGQGRTDGLLKVAGVAEGADQAVMGFSVRRVGGDGGAKGAGSAGWLAGCKQFNATLGERIGGGVVGWGHGCL